MEKEMEMLLQGLKYLADELSKFVNAVIALGEGLQKIAERAKKEGEG